MADQEGAAGGSPVLLVVHRRLRAAKKKLTKIQELEAQQSSGKQLNADQLATLTTKQFVLATVEELEKIQEPLHAAIAEEVQLARDKAATDALAKAQAQVEAQLQEERAKADKEWERKLHAMQKERDDAREAKKAAEKKLEKQRQETPLKHQAKPLIEKLLELFYYSKVFDISNQMLSEYEKAACLAHDKRVGGGGAAGAALEALDLGELSYFGRIMMDRNAAAAGSHKETLDKAVELALQWLYSPKAVAIPASAMGPPKDVTMEQLQRTLARIRKSDYHTVPPS
eukprot:CAMPEP_0202864522 /NCGR_PEP_ID=MMETSP1391-20130828/4729_1 /ASSEMBLY_ACC=CAM_ASM_000867 /TAXON_ID=1034604 /ORGANISM="Chlamydomonas leiostraca, Strain SAG 11-49" /LENGTH=284 /DNA_ID=CAMNT_0049544273 /DNA_START=117 /DNA_END=968 /DNA_ORIENTATION=+